MTVTARTVFSCANSETTQDGWSAEIGVSPIIQINTTV